MRFLRLMAIGVVLLVLVGAVLGTACAGAEGEQGPQGGDGVGIQNVASNGDGTVTISLTDGSTYTTDMVTGPQGPQGVKGDTGAQGIQGVKGDNGAQGVQGIQGAKGDTGAQGPQGAIGTNMIVASGMVGRVTSENVSGTIMKSYNVDSFVLGHFVQTVYRAPSEASVVSLNTQNVYSYTIKLSGIYYTTGNYIVLTSILEPQGYWIGLRGYDYFEPIQTCYVSADGAGNLKIKDYGCGFSFVVLAVP